MKRTGMKPRTEPMARTPIRRFKVIDGDGAPVIQIPQQRTPIKAVSLKRARQNRERAAMADRLYPDRREGTVMCAVPWCPRLADDLHEPKSRARGGAITDENNAEPLCRKHHDQVTFAPENQLQWAYDLGLLVHSWNDGGPAA
jgi:hypothetical protein